MIEDRVSVVVPTHNSETFVAETLASIAGQTYGDLEVLVTDDASTDGTVEIVRTLAESDSRFRVSVQDRRRGAAAARNDAIRRATGRFLAFCDSDDLWGPEKLARQLSYARERGAAIAFTAYELMDVDGRRLGRFVDRGNVEWVDYQGMLRKRATMGCSTVIVDRAQVQDLAMPDLATGQDYATWLQILRRGFRAYCLDDPLTRYRIRPGSISRNKVRKARRQWQIYRELEELDLPTSVSCFAHYAVRAVFRR